MLAVAPPKLLKAEAERVSTRRSTTLTKTGTERRIKRHQGIDPRRGGRATATPEDIRVRSITLQRAVLVGTLGFNSEESSMSDMHGAVDFFALNVAA